MAHSHSGARTGEGSGTLILVWSNPSSPSPLRRRLVRHHHQRPAVVGRQHEHGRQDLCRLHRFDPQAHLGARRLPGHGWQALPGQLAARTPPPPALPASPSPTACHCNVAATCRPRVPCPPTLVPHSLFPVLAPASPLAPVQPPRPCRPSCLSTSCPLPPTCPAPLCAQSSVLCRVHPPGTSNIPWRLGTARPRFAHWKGWCGTSWGRCCCCCWCCRATARGLRRTARPPCAPPPPAPPGPVRAGFKKTSCFLVPPPLPTLTPAHQPQQQQQQQYHPLL